MIEGLHFIDLIGPGKKRLEADVFLHKNNQVCVPVDLVGFHISGDDDSV